MYVHAKALKMLEIEIKARIKKPLEIENTILSRGGRFCKEVYEEDVYFNHPAKDFANTDEALRLRHVGGRYFLTYKGPKLDNLTKTREEFNVEVKDFENASSILKVLGFSEVLQIKKKRRYFLLGEYEIMLDHLAELGDFIEVEKRGEYNPEEMIDFLKDLGIQGSETKSYLELMLENKGKQ
jgi:adenylate cyclase class 2